MATARGGGHRPYSRNVGRPENSRAAPSTTSRSNRRRAARPVIGAWRAASAGETQSWASRRSTIFWAGFERSLGATAIRVFGAAGKIGGEVEGGGGGERDRACGGVWPGWVARPWPSSGARRSQGRIQDFRGDQRHGPRPAQPDGDDHVEHPERQNFGWGRLGRPGGRRTPGRRPLRPPKPDRPPLRKPSGSLRGRSGPQARSSRAAASKIRPGSRLGGRPAPSRQSDKRFAAGPSGSPTAKRRSRSAAASALRRRILAEAAALCSARRARSAPAAGGSARRKASRSASPAPAANSGSPCPALPLARAQAGIGAGGGNGCRSGVFAWLGWLARASRAAQEGAPQGREAVGEQVEIGANHLGMVNRRRRFVTLCGAEIRPACRGVGDVR